jgi:hypothetical protein
MRLLAFAAALTLWASIGHAEKLTASQAKTHEGESGTVCGTVCE